ncbi:29617_t:CDS:1, partial [Gigaspora margarita]
VLLSINLEIKEFELKTKLTLESFLNYSDYKGIFDKDTGYVKD